MENAMFSKQEIMSIVNDNIGAYANDMDISNEQLFCIIDKYLVSENIDGEDFSCLTIDVLNESVKSIKLCNGFFNFKEALTDILGVCLDSIQVKTDILTSKFGFGSVLLIIKIIAELFHISKIEFGYDEYFIIITLLNSSKSSVKEEDLMNLYRTNSKENLEKETARMLVSNAVNNLLKYKCIDMNDGEIKIVEKIFSNSAGHRG